MGSKVNPYQDMRWQTIDRICKENGLKRGVVKRDHTVLRHCIYWYRADKEFDYGEFYHTYGVPGIWFQGFLPMAEFAKDNTSPNKYGFFEFEIKNMEMFYAVLNELKKVDKKELLKDAERT